MVRGVSILNEVDRVRMMSVLEGHPSWWGVCLREVSVLKKYPSMIYAHFREVSTLERCLP